MYIKLELINFDNDDKVFADESYDRQGIFLVHSPVGYYVVAADNGMRGAYVFLGTSGIVDDKDLVPRKELDAANDTISQKDMRIVELEMALRTPSSGISEDTLLKVIEMFLQHPQTQQPCIYPTIPTTPSSPFPPDVVYCNGVSGTSVKTE